MLLLLLLHVFSVVPPSDTANLSGTGINPGLNASSSLVRSEELRVTHEIRVAIANTAAARTAANTAAARTAANTAAARTAVDTTVYTVADTIMAGEVFITNLPDSIDGMRSVRYAGIELPTRSWLRNQTFFWKTTESDRGDHALWFYVFREADMVIPADSVVIHVTIR